MNAHTTLILNVDDNEGARYVKSRVLRHAGYPVIEAATGQAALEAVREQAPAIVLLDVKLPDISGIEVCRLIKADAQTNSTLVLQTSAAAVQTRDKILALDGGADSYLTEPVEPAELVANVRALLRLYAAEKALRDADRRKDRFLATLAHELRNPLAPIRNAIELLDPRHGANDVMRADARQIASRQVEHLGRLVDDLLDVSRISHGKIALQMSTLDLREIVQIAVETSRPFLDAKAQTLTVEIDCEPCHVTGDAIRVAQIISNLLSNAAKYTAEGGQIALRLEADVYEILIRVRDNGIGIAPDELPYVFELFMQSREAVKRADGGLGIGLALVRELAELHGGSASAHSDGLGLGSEFVVRLPLARAPQCEAPRDEPHGAREQIAPPRRRVLIADDNVDSASSLLMLLELEGHEVRVAHDGPGALALAQSFLPNVAILDIGLPGMDGHALAKALRAAPATAHVQLIALTGYGQERDRQAASEAGFDRHLVKPAPFEEILREIENAPPD
ncbi:response regulator [Paraburkholderia sp. CNPSo 3272]|uniref:ATP-binding response regulator n=1 Tax=Paraburkholderia sp. CNPSo 3272 TaxID=2940931 RepID=UPI0020B8FF1C|nr:response regulator [Paraburkholderia sp. CNPSo 3272]MCP3723627.1 response regulator [Paraburkholderia sp. CNPSo 3272]